MKFEMAMLKFNEKLYFNLYSLEHCCKNSILRSVVQKMGNAIHRINRYPADSVVGFVNAYPLDSDLSVG